MASVTARISQITQPRGGYIKPSEYTQLNLNDGKILEEENIHSSIVGMVVDYLTRYFIRKQSGFNNKDSVESAFIISITGYLERLKLLGDQVLGEDIDNKVDIKYLLGNINGLDDESIRAACKITTYDVWFRNPMAAMMATGASLTNPDKQTINNIRIMVERSISFFEKFGPVVEDGFTFEKDGYTSVVDSGDGDFLTKSTMWDFKVSINKPNNKQTLQLLMYWIMGQHSKKPEFKNISTLGIYNPRLNIAYVYELKNLSKDVIEEVERNVICYE